MALVIAVGTQNPAKLEAVKLAFKAIYSDRTIEVHGLTVDSCVSSQPMSALESIQGAKNRAIAALNQDEQAVYGVGLEGGLEHIGDEWFDCGWCAIIDREQQIGLGSSARIATPASIMKFVDEGTELGEAIDILFGVHNAGQKEGHFGLMTNNTVTRTAGYVQGICMAFSRFLHPEIFTA